MKPATPEYLKGWRYPASKHMKQTDQAAKLGVSKQRVNQSKKIAKNADGSVDVAKTEDIHAATLRKESALANLRELEFAEKAGKLIPVDEAEGAWLTVMRSIRDLVLGIPSRTATQLAAMSDPRAVQVLLEGELRKALAILSEKVPTLEAETVL